MFLIFIFDIFYDLKHILLFLLNISKPAFVFRFKHNFYQIRERDSKKTKTSIMIEKSEITKLYYKKQHIKYVNRLMIALL